MGGKRFVLALLISFACTVSTFADLLDVFGNVIPGTAGLQLRPGARLEELDLTGLNVRDVSISGASFAGSTLNGSQILVELPNVNFSDAFIEDVFFSSVSPEQIYSTRSYQERNLAGVRIAEYEPVEWNFHGQGLRRARLDGNFMNADFRDSDLRNTILTATFADESGEAVSDFTNARIDFAELWAKSISEEQLYSTANYQSRNLRGVNFRARPAFFTVIPFEMPGWDFRGGNLTDAKMANANAAGADFSESRLVGANLTVAELTGARFVDAELLDSDFFRADLTDTDFSGARLANADLRGATFEGTTFRDTNLQNANLKFSQGLRPESFSGETTYNQWTVFPDGFDPVSAGLTNVEWQRGDFDGDQQIGVGDIDLLLRRYIRGNDSPGPYIVDEENLRIYADSSRNAAYTSDTVEGLRLLYEQLTKGKNDNWLEPMYDLDGNGRVNRNDFRRFLEDVAKTWIGDSNFDGEFNSGDFVTVFSANEYEDDLQGNSTWATGDWNGDKEFNSRDFITAFADGGYEQGKRVAAAVPESIPSASYLFACVASVWIVGGMRRKVKNV